MKTTYTRYTLDGEHSADAAQRALGEAASQGLVVRLDVKGGKTHIYLASQGKSEVKALGRGKKAAVGAIKGVVVSESEVTKL
jgi:hypothetical protein